MDIKKNSKIRIWWELTLRRIDDRLSELTKQKPMTDLEKAVAIQATVDPDEEIFDILAQYFKLKRCPCCEGLGLRNED